MDIKVIIPKKPFEEIIADPINALAIQWLIDHSIHNRFDGSAKAFLLRACNLANIYKDELKVIYEKSRKVKEAECA